MRFSDFEYDGLKLSDFTVTTPQKEKFAICEFDGSGDDNIVSAGSTITFNKSAVNHGTRHLVSGYQYDECITATFDICKLPVLCDGNIATYSNLEIYDIEYQRLMRWLNRPAFHSLHFTPDAEDKSRDLNLRDLYFNASFNVEKIYIADKLYGLRLTVETDRPFALGQAVSQTTAMSGQTSKQISVKDTSDAPGYTPVRLTIQYKTSGVSASNTVKIYNTKTSDEVIITNGKAGEIVVIDAETQVITTSVNNHSLPDNFNFSYLRLSNVTNLSCAGYSDNANAITITDSNGVLNGVTIEYTPVIKDSI